MFGKISRGWTLVKQSWGVLRVNKRLMVLPVLSSLACLLLVASFATPFVFSPTLRSAVMEYVEKHNQNGDVNGFQFTVHSVTPWLLTFAFYLCMNFVIVFFNTALACCAMNCFAGGEARLGDGLRAAMSRFPQILGWALLAATVGTLLKAIEERVPVVGKFVVSLIGMAWAVVTFMVVPVLAAERLGPFGAVKRSTELLRKSWGESLTGQVTFGAMNLVFMLPVIVAVPIGVALAVNNAIWFAVALGVLTVIYVIGLMIVSSTLQQIFLAAVYRYAADGQVPAGFSEDLIKSAFKVKQ